MWNGLWKLTLMVGVVGVGIFAAYHAQKGMNLTVSNAPKGSDDSKNERVGSSTDEASDDTSNPQEPAFLAGLDEPSEKPSQRRASKETKSRTDFLDDFSLDEPSVKTASAKDEGKTVPVKRNQKRPGIDFRESAEPLDAASDRSAEPKRLPDEESSELVSPKKNRQPIRQVKADVSENESATAATENQLDPFAEDNEDTQKAAQKTTLEKNSSTKSESTAKKSAPASFDEPAESEFPTEVSETENKKTPAADKEKFELETPEQAPGRAKVSTGIGADSEPPRSKRAKQGAVKRFENQTESEADPFSSDSRVNPARSPATSKSGTGKSLSDLDAPKQIDEPAREEPAIVNDPAAAPRSLPNESNNISNVSNEDVPAPRTNPKRNRPAIPATLSEDPNPGFLNEAPKRTHESHSRRSDRDPVSSVDMVGDGIAGDASQRGVQQPRLTIEKVAAQQAVLEQPLVYSIIVKNTGSVDAHNVVIEDRIPKGTELLGTAPQAELSGKRLIWNHLLLKPNEEKKISIKVIPHQEGPIGSVARVYFATEVSAEIVVSAPQLDFTVKAPSEVRIGQHFELVFTLKNVGTVDATNIKVFDVVPDELKNEAGADIECAIGKMAPQETREIVLPVTAIKTGNLVNKAVMTADPGIKKSLDSSINVIGELLVLTRTGQNKLYVERAAVFTNNIRNDGNQRADSVRISEVVPAGMQFETASDGGKYDANLKAVVWTVGPLPPGVDKSVSVKYVPKETGPRETKISATGSAGSTAAIQSTIEVVGKPELQMETLTATGTVTVGDRITSKFQLNNTGTAAARNVRLRIKLPRELKLISVKGAKFQKEEDSVVFETIGELPPRTKAAYELVLEPIAEADAQIGLEISADHLSKPGRRVETIQIANDALK